MWSALPSVALENLIVPGPVERGFYVAPGGGELVPAVTKKLVDLLDVESASVTEPAVPLYKLRYSQTRYWRRNSRIGQLLWIDSGNIFDGYGLSMEARKRRLDPNRILRAVKVTRPFSLLQFQQMLERVPNPALWAPNNSGFPPLPERVRGEGLKNSQAVWWTPLVIISDLMGMFYDPNVSEESVIRAFRSFMIRLSFLRQRAIVLAFLRNEPAPLTRQHLLPDVLKLARRVYSQPDAQVPPAPLLARVG